MNRPLLHLLLRGGLMPGERRRMVRQLIAAGRLRAHADTRGPSRITIVAEPSNQLARQAWMQMLEGYPELSELPLRWHDAAQPPTLQAGDLLVMLSSGRLANACLAEALRQGVPVLVPDDMTGLGIRDGINGFHFRARDIDSLALSLMAWQFMGNTQ